MTIKKWFTDITSSKKEIPFDSLEPSEKHRLIQKVLENAIIMAAEEAP